MGACPSVIGCPRTLMTPYHRGRTRCPLIPSRSWSQASCGREAAHRVRREVASTHRASEASFWGNTYLQVCECNREWVLKNCIKKRFSGCPYHRSSPCFPPRLSGGYQHRWGRSAKEPHQSLHVLRYRGQEELLTHEFQSPQTQATQPDLILKFCE